MPTSDSTGNLSGTAEYSALRRLVIDWLDDNFHFGEAEALIGDDDRSFLDNGILASLGFVQLVVYLEDRTRITIDRKDLTRENFDSLAKIVTYVLKHRDFQGLS
jgi:acyl carrier protein